MSGAVGSVFQVDIQVNAYGDFISNRYHVFATSFDDASIQGAKIAAAQAALLPTTVNIDKILVSTPAKGDKAFRSTTVNIPGTRNSASDVLPPFNRYRVDFNVGDRRPLRKYLLWPIESGTTGGGFAQSEVDYVTQNYITPLLSSNGPKLCAEDGSLVLNASLNQRVGMHQLRRGSKRKKKPVI